ncbi:spherulation-specific family 4 protein [Fodinicola acaciae]|uniref:spherulation-specific family 4 protein n=1 Tax=Fodinicola acaciae TaxID=2681555 RepID=UPI0013D20AE7|nr:spherulation-specific family 4 protein [Fodinicola acaciae]
MARKRLAVAAAIAMLFTGASPAAAYCAPAQNVAVPAYFSPSPGAGLDAWNQLIDTTPAGGVVVFTVGNLGPGPTPDPDYQDVVRRAQAKGIKAVCYVETLEANGVDVRPLADAKRDIDRCFAQYQPAGIFLDEVQGTTARLAGVRTLSAYVRQNHPNALRVLNAGQNTVEAYADISDILAIFEGPWSGSPVGYNYQDWQPDAWVASWISTHPNGASHFWHMAYATSAADLAAAVARSRTLQAGYVYVTDGTGDERWDHLPPYWQQEIDSVYD